MKGIRDLIYGFGIWIIMRWNKETAANLLEQWAFALRRDSDTDSPK